MYWSAVLVLALTGPNEQLMNVAHSPANASFESYTQAWNAAKEAELPMLIILNPPSETAAIAAITEQKLQEDKAIEPLLENYVVAVINTGTEHGQKVHELFGNKSLPRVVVIDKEQKKQLYQNTTNTTEGLSKVLDQHKSGTYTVPVLNWVPPADCPSCQRGFQF